MCGWGGGGGTGGDNMWKAWDFQREHGGRRTPYQCDLSLSPMKFFWQFLPTGHLYYLTFLGSSLSHFFSLIIPSLQTQKTHFSSSNIHISESPYLFLDLRQSKWREILWTILLFSFLDLFLLQRQFLSPLLHFSLCWRCFQFTYLLSDLSDWRLLGWAAVWCKASSTGGLSR